MALLVIRLIAAIVVGIVALVPDTPPEWRQTAVVMLVAGLITVLLQDFRRRAAAS